MSRSYVSAALAGLIALGAAPAFSQGFPNKPIRMLTSAVGGGADVAARVIAQELTAGIGQQVLVENFGGAGYVAALQVMKAPPDGYTLLAYGPPFWIGPLMTKAPYDPLRDFIAVSLAISSPNILVVHPSVPATTVREFVALAKARPGSLNYASGQSGSSNHLAAELFKAMAGVDLVRVGYKSGGSAITDLIAGRVQVSFSSAPIVGGHIKAGKLRALGVTSAQPSALAPGIPTLSEAGVPGYESSSIIGVFAPARTPAAVGTRLNQEISRGLQRPEVKDRLFKAGSEPMESSPEQAAAYLRNDVDRMGKVIRDAGIREEE